MPGRHCDCPVETKRRREAAPHFPYSVSREGPEERKAALSCKRWLDLMSPGMCRLLVKQYVPEIMKAVVALPEQQVCGAVGLCSSSAMTGEVPMAAAQ